MAVKIINTHSLIIKDFQDDQTLLSVENRVLLSVPLRFGSLQYYGFEVMFDALILVAGTGSNLSWMGQILGMG